MSIRAIVTTENQNGGSSGTEIDGNLKQERVVLGQILGKLQRSLPLLLPLLWLLPLLLLLSGTVAVKWYRHCYC